jgi:zinc protease
MPRLQAASHKIEKMKNTGIKKIMLAVLALAIMNVNGSCQQGKSKSPIIGMDPAVRIGKLANGFTYYIRKNQEPKNRVLIYLVNKAGSILEDEDQRGLAHFMEHMSFNGTAHFPHNELVNYLQKAGIRFGADINAYTSFDETVYELPLPSNRPDILNTGFEIIHDWTKFATLDPQEIDKERGVVLEEERLGKGASERMKRQYMPAILNHSRYAERIPIGIDQVLKNFGRPAIERFYKDWYRPDLQAIIVVGDIDANAVEQKIKKQFSDLKNPAKERERIHYSIKLNGENHFVEVTDKEMTSTNMEISMKYPAASIKTEADYRQVVLEHLFNQMLAGRFAELVRQSDPPFQQGSAGVGGLLANINSFSLKVNAKPGELEKGFRAGWRELMQLQEFGFTQTEIDRAKKNYSAGMQEALKEKNKTPSEAFVKEYQGNFLQGTPFPGIETEVRLAEAALKDISLNDENRLVKAYLKNTDRDIMILAPEKDKASLPAEAVVNNWMKTIEQEKLAPYKDKISTLPFLTAQPVPGSITSETKNEKLNITTLVLSNGVKVVIKSTDFKNNEIAFSSFASGGVSTASDEDYESAANAADIIKSNGAGNYNLTELGKFLSGKQLNVNPYINDRYEGINGSSTPADLETALQLIYADFTEPRWDTAIFNSIISRSKAALANRANDPNGVFSDSVKAIMYNNNLRRTGPNIAKLMQIKPEEAFRFYKERFSDASGFTFTFVGNISLNTIKPLLQKYLGSLLTTHRKINARDLGIHIASGNIEKTVYKGTADRSTVIQVYSGKFDYNYENRVRMQALKECLEIRMLERLREDESGVYSPGVFVTVSKDPEPRYSFVIQFGCAPQNVDRLVASSKDEISKLIAKGPLQVNVDKWHAEDNASTETALKTNRFWLGYITTQLQTGDDTDEILNYNDIKNAVTPAALKSTATKYLDGKN